MGVRETAEALVARAAALGHRGSILTPEERDQIATALPVYPRWLLDLLSYIPLCGLRLGWRPYLAEGSHGRVRYVGVSDARNILAESRDFYPGVGILPAGYINFGDSDGSGDPYFLCVHEGEDPPLYQVYHDAGVDAVTILSHGRERIAASLSEFFSLAILDSGQEE